MRRRHDEAARKLQAQERIAHQQAALDEQLKRQQELRRREFDAKAARAAEVTRTDAEDLSRDAAEKARARNRAIDNARLLTQQIHDVAQRKANERMLAVTQEELKYNKDLMMSAGVAV